MKKSLVAILLLLCFALLSCDKMPLDSRFDGMWQLMSVEQGEQRFDVKSKRIYWSVRRNIVQYSASEMPFIYSHVIIRNDSLTLIDFFHDTEAAVEGDDNQQVLPSESSVLESVGVYASPVGSALRASYYVERVGSSQLVLRGERSVVVFRKF